MPVPRPVHHRFAAWVTWFRENNRDENGKPPSLEAVGKHIGCSQAYVSALISGQRTVAELESAHKIESATESWPEGPIRTEEWLDIGSARRVIPSRRRPAAPGAR